MPQRDHVEPWRPPVDDWSKLANCHGQADVMFPAPGSGKAFDWGPARALCASCPVKAQCLAHAIEHDEWQGMWGGTTPSERGTARRFGGRAPQPIRHGTEGGYRAHRYREEEACDACKRAANAAKLARKTDTQPHGTLAAYKRHLRDGTQICDECRRANTTATAQARARTAETRAERLRKILARG